MPKKVKILYLVTESEWAGASRYVFDLATHLPLGFEAVVAAGGRGDALKALNARGIRTVRLRWLPRAIKPINDFLAFWEILFLYFRERPSIIHLNSSKAGWLGSVAGVLYGVARSVTGLLRNDEVLRIVFTPHGWAFNEPGRANWFFRGLERFASRTRDVIICVSEHDRQEALRFRIAPPHKLITIHNGIDLTGLDFFDRETARAELRKKMSRVYKSSDRIFCTPVIGAIANFYPNKGLQYLIEAIDLLRTNTKYVHPFASLEVRPPKSFRFCRKIPNTKYEIRCIIIGDGPLRPTLESLIEKHDLTGRVFLAGQVPEAWRYIRAFDCFVLPSIKEGLPYAILEALAAGVPVVASAVGGVAEIKAHGGAVRLTAPGNPQTLAEGITALLHERRSAAPAFPVEFSIGRMVEKTVAVYGHP